ncbi:MAG: multidrug effflux MFS transporter [Clostridium perfringens]|nr:multidrug effflux MFS transporter [Clostridium perfringens]
MGKSQNNKTRHQKYLGNLGFIIFIGFLSAFVPLSTDLYLPALPSMVTSLHTTEGILNLTIIFFFVFYALGMLFWGPLSDKYGRKKILTIGMIIYCIGSLLCATTSNIPMLIIFRIIQAIGSGSAVSVATAMMKDIYTGKKLVSMLATVQSIAMTSPVVSPVIGAFILTFTSWHGIFWILTIVSVVAIIGSLLLEETLKNYDTGSVLKVLDNLRVVGKNPGFAILLFLFAITILPLMAYITMSSYIYIDGFKLNDQVYSYFYACTAIFLIIGPMAYVRLAKHFTSKKIIIADFIVILLSGIALIIFGPISPWAFALCLIPAMACGNMLRPPSTHLILAQQDTNIGSASSLISFGNTIMGCVGMVIITFNVGNKIVAIGFLYALVALIALVLWLIFNNKSFIVQVQEHNH